MTTKKVEELRVVMLKGRTDLQDFMDAHKVEMSPEEIEKLRSKPPVFSTPLLPIPVTEDSEKYQIVLKTKEDAMELKRLTDEMQRTQREFYAAFMELKNQEKDNEETTHTQMEND